MVGWSPGRGMPDGDVERRLTEAFEQIARLSDRLDRGVAHGWEHAEGGPNRTPTGRSATLMVAGDGSSGTERAQADRVASGPDCSPVLQRALDAVGDWGGGVVKVASGRFPLAGSLTIPGDTVLELSANTTLAMAAGVSITLGTANSGIVGASRSSSVITVANNTNRIVLSAADLIVAGITISGSYTGTGPTGGVIAAQGIARPVLRDIWIAGGAGIWLNTCTDIDLADIIITGITCDSAGVSVGSCTGGKLSGIILQGIVFPGPSAQRGIYCQTSSRLTLSDCIVRGCDFSYQSGAAGISLSGSSFCSVNDCVSSDNIAADGLLTEESSVDIAINGGVYSRNGRVIGAAGVKSAQYPYENGDGLDIFNSQRITINGVIANGNGGYNSRAHHNVEIYTSTDVTVVGAEASDGDSAGFQVVGSPNTHLIGCRANRNQYSGIYVLRNPSAPNEESTNIEIIGGECTDNSKANGSGTEQQCGIYLANASTGLIAGVRLADTLVGANRTQLYGLRLENTANARIMLNRFNNNKTGALLDSVGTSVVRYNEGYITENGGAAASVGDGGTIAHSLAAVPTWALAVPTVAGEMVGITAMNGSQLTVAIKTHAGAAGTSQTIYWRAWA